MEGIKGGRAYEITKRENRGAPLVRVSRCSGNLEVWLSTGNRLRLYQKKNINRGTNLQNSHQRGEDELRGVIIPSFLRRKVLNTWAGKLASVKEKKTGEAPVLKIGGVKREWV